MNKFSLGVSLFFITGCSQQFTGELKLNSQGEVLFFECSTNQLYKFEKNIQPSFYVYLEDGKQLLKSGSVLVSIKAFQKNGVLINPKEKNMHQAGCKAHNKPINQDK